MAQCLPPWYCKTKLESKHKELRRKSKLQLKIHAKLRYMRCYFSLINGQNINQPIVYEGVGRLITVALIFVIILTLLVISCEPIPLSFKPCTTRCIMNKDSKQILS